MVTVTLSVTLQLRSLRSEPSFDTEPQDEVQGRRQGDPELIEGSPYASRIHPDPAFGGRTDEGVRDELGMSF